MIADIRHALRALRAGPLFSVMAILTLGIAIGGTASIFSVVNAALLRPLPFADPEELVRVSLMTNDDPDMVWSYPKYELLRDEQRVFLHTAGYAPWAGDLSGSGEPERITGEMVTENYFDILGIRPVSGRVFTPDEVRNPGAAAVVVISEALRNRRFGSDMDAVGRTVQLNGNIATIIGVVPSQFRGLTGVADVFVPITAAGDMLTGPWAHFMTVIARLLPGSTVENARSEVAVLGQRIDEAYRSPRDPAPMGASIRRLDELRVDPAIRRAVLVLFGAVTGVLLIACVNISNLLVARAMGRKREIAVRRAIGAGNARLVRQLLTESLVLALAGGLFGILLAWSGVRVLGAAAANAGDVLGRSVSGLDVITLAGIRIDGSVLLFASIITILTGLLFGAAPAVQAARADLTPDLGHGSTASTHEARRLFSRNTLVVIQIAIAFILLVGSGLMLRSLSRLLNTSAGIEPRNLLTVRLEQAASNSPEQRAIFWQSLVDRAAGLRGVHGAAIVDCPPLIGRCNVRPLWLGTAGASMPEPVGVHFITADYVRAVGSTLQRGRAFDHRDRSGSPNVVLINETAARKFFPGEDPIGRRIAVGGGFADGAEIVGVLGDQRFAAPETPPEPDVYIAYDQVPQLSGYLLLRTSGEPTALIPAVRSIVRELNPNLPLHDVRTMEQRVGSATSRTRLAGLLLAAFAAVALILAVLGTYAVIAYAVSHRTREIGVRIALGAMPREVALMIMRDGAFLVGGGLLLGMIGASSLTRVMRSLLFETAPSQTGVFLLAVVAVLAAGLLAIALPAARAARVQPVLALRSEM